MALPSVVVQPLAILSDYTPSLAIAFQRPSKVEPELDRRPGSGHCLDLWSARIALMAPGAAELAIFLLWKAKLLNWSVFCQLGQGIGLSR
ncbi:hypothetical protein D3C80_181110 [compost metagenome]